MTVESAPSARGRYSRLGAIGPPLLLLFFMWALELLDLLLSGRLDSAGIEPRETQGLLGIVFAPLLHGGFNHLLSNTIPLLVLASGRGIFWRVTTIVVLLGGCGTWLIAPADTVTIGASGLVFGYLGYLLVAGIRTRHWRDLLIGALVLIVYGTLLLGALPWTVADNVSWQGHLTGALAGGLAAWWVAPRPPARRTGT